MDRSQCFNCPTPVLHYRSNKRLIYCCEFHYQGYTITIFISNFNDTPVNDGEVLVISNYKRGYYSTICFASDFGITPNNIEVKLKTILTLQ